MTEAANAKHFIGQAAVNAKGNLGKAAANILGSPNVKTWEVTWGSVLDNIECKKPFSIEGTLIIMQVYVCPLYSAISI